MYIVGCFSNTNGMEFHETNSITYLKPKQTELLKKQNTCSVGTVDTAFKVLRVPEPLHWIIAQFVFTGELTM